MKGIFNQKGFTLLEVLLAGFILFLVLSSMTLVYKGAMLSSSKAERSLETSSVFPSIRKIITDSFRSSSDKPIYSGSGLYLGVEYKWAAKPVQQGRPSEFLIEDMKLDARFVLWDVELNLSNGASNRVYKFRELSW